MADNWVSGVEGAYYYGGAEHKIDGWTMRIDLPVEDLGAMGSSGELNYYTGRKNFSGTVDGRYYIDTSTGTTTPPQALEADAGKGGTLVEGLAKFIETTGSMWWGNVVVSNISKGARKENYQTWSGTWTQGSGGPLTKANSTAT